MKQERGSIMHVMRVPKRSLWGAAVVGLGLVCTTLGAAGQEDLDADADTILKAMSDYLGGLAAYSVRFDVDTEVVDEEGQKLMFSKSGHLVLKRPDKLFASREGAVANVEVRFNGKSLALYGKALNVYLQRDVEGTIDDALDTLMFDLDVHAPGADLLASDVYSLLMSDVKEGIHVGEAVLGGKKVHHLAFRTPRVDWQMWVQAEGDPLPLRYVITSKWVTGAPQYSVRLTDWNV
jgi:hypothetical protein